MLVATILGSSMAFIDSTVVNVALPALQTALSADAADVQWVIEVYSLFLAALLLVGGSLGDRYGRRRVLRHRGHNFRRRLGLVWFRAGHSPAHHRARHSGNRCGPLVPGSLAIISSSFREEERGRAIGTWSGFSAMTAAIGPVLGGWLVDQVSWRAVFFINIPLAIVVIVISLWRVPESAGHANGRLDWPGALLAAAGSGHIGLCAD